MASLTELPRTNGRSGSRAAVQSMAGPDCRLLITHRRARGVMRRRITYKYKVRVNYAIHQAGSLIATSKRMPSIVSIVTPRRRCSSLKGSTSLP